ncbi:hypothetical protein [Leptospira sarikeiensis]|uniref:Uncharacterized protein n=1 Tax=Leptospira sarikeiensis TaxID=2484943 RepID=A0A4R9JZE8_9LEPT|nr:hypothetical protein [Leptospira sarikeiensis]TGL57621.1 hypothetical protein EHQ64_19690 [Leptospira sarikeiensis]
MNSGKKQIGEFRSKWLTSRKTYLALFAFLIGFIISSAHTHEASEKSLLSKHSSKITHEVCIICSQIQAHANANLDQKIESKDPVLEYKEILIFNASPITKPQTANIQGRSPPLFS